MKICLYNVNDNYIQYLRQYNSYVNDNKIVKRFANKIIDNSEANEDLKFLFKSGTSYVESIDLKDKRSVHIQKCLGNIILMNNLKD